MFSFFTASIGVIRLGGGVYCVGWCAVCVVRWVSGVFGFVYGEDSGLSEVNVVTRFGPLRLNRGCLVSRTGGRNRIMVTLDSGFIRHNSATVYRGHIHARVTLDYNTSLILRVPIYCSVSATRGFTLNKISTLVTTKYSAVVFNDRTKRDRPLVLATRVLVYSRFGSGLDSTLGDNIAFTGTERTATRDLNAPGNVLRNTGGGLTVRCVVTTGDLGTSVRFGTIGERNTTRSDSTSCNNFTSTSLVHRGLGGNSFSFTRECVPTKTFLLVGCSGVSGVDQVRATVLTTLHAGAVGRLGGLPSIDRKLRGGLFSTVGITASLSSICGGIGDGHCARTHVHQVILSTFLKLSGDFFVGRPPCVQILKFGCGNGTVVGRRGGGGLVLGMRRVGARGVFLVRGHTASLCVLSLGGTNRYSLRCGTGLVGAR